MLILPKQYCSQICRKAHWESFHNIDCEATLSKPTWYPLWDVEKRRAAFSNDDVVNSRPHPFDGTTNLWGKTEAIDVIRLSENEGAKFDGNLRLLFASVFSFFLTPYVPVPVPND